MAQSTQDEIDRALSAAREVWAANDEEKLEKRVRQLEANIRQQLEAKYQEENRQRQQLEAKYQEENRQRQQLEAKYQEENRQIVDEALREAEARFKSEKLKLEEELRSKVSSYFSLMAYKLICLTFPRRNQPESAPVYHFA